MIIKIPPIRSQTLIGIVAGNFDVIHPGYVRLFEDAKENACNYLIVALQGDPTIERPDKCKPVQSIEEREYILNNYEKDIWKSADGLKWEEVTEHIN